jgi:hypothetical protein
MERRTIDETNALTGHLVYEIEMVSELVNRFVRFRLHLGSGLSSDDVYQAEVADLSGRNADIDSFAIHARVLVDFFFGGREGEDAIAADFFNTDADWYAVRPKQSGILKRVNTRVGKEIAHLSYRRKDPAQAWSYSLVWGELAKVIEAFVDNVPDDRLDAAASKRIRAALPARSVLTLPLPDASLDLGATSALPLYVAPATTYTISSNEGTATLPFVPGTPLSD